MVTMPVTINITIVDEEKFKEHIFEQYGDVDEENIAEYIEEHIKANSTCDSFVVEGADTDGCLVQSCDIDELMEKIEDREDEDYDED